MSQKSILDKSTVMFCAKVLQLTHPLLQNHKWFHIPIVLLIKKKKCSSWIWFFKASSEEGKHGRIIQMSFPATRSLCSHGRKLSLPDGQTSVPDLSAALMYSVGHSRLCHPRNSIASDLWWLNHPPYPTTLRMITAEHVCCPLGRLAGQRHFAHTCLKRVKKI